MEGWRNRATQVARRQAVAETVPDGNLAAVLAVIDDEAARQADAQGFAAARHAAGQIDARLALLRAGGESRAGTAMRLGQETAAVLGLAALVAAIIAAALA
jgi:hypothetical protein